MPTQFNFLWQLGSGAVWPILIGIVSAAIFVAFVWLVIKGLKPNGRLSIIGMLTGALMLILLIIQFVPTLVAFNLKGTIDDISASNSLISSRLFGGGISEVTSEYVESFAEKAHSYLDNFIFKSLLIALAEAVICISIVWLTLEESSCPVRHRRGSGNMRINQSNHILTRNGKSYSNRSRRHRL